MEDKPTPLDMDKVSRLNTDLAERLFKEGVHLAYEEDADVLLMTIGEGKLAVTTPIIDGIYVCVEPESLKIIGFTIIEFASNLLANNRLLRKLFPNALELLRANDGILVWEGQQAQKLKNLFHFAEFAVSR
jgi:hypothetical protein